MSPFSYLFWCSVVRCIDVWSFLGELTFLLCPVISGHYTSKFSSENNVDTQLCYHGVSFYFLTLTFLKNVGPLFYKMSPSLGLSDCFLWPISSSAFLLGIPLMWCCVLLRASTQVICNVNLKKFSSALKCIFNILLIC